MMSFPALALLLSAATVQPVKIGAVANVLGTNAVKDIAIEGKVILSMPKSLVIQDMTGSIVAELRSGGGAAVGDIVRADGSIRHMDPGLPWLEVSSLSVLRHESSPSPQEAKLSDVVKGAYNFKPVVCRGVLTDVMIDDVDPDWCWLLAGDEGEHLSVAMPVPADGLGGVRALIDAEISVTSVPTPDLGYRRFLSSRMVIPSLESVAVLKPPAPDPFAVGEFSNTAQDHFADPARFAHRLKVSGILVASWRRRYMFVNSGPRRNLLVDTGRERDLPPAGTPVTAAGFIRFNAFHARMDNAELRIDSQAPADAEMPRVRDVTIDQISVSAKRPKSTAKPVLNPFRHGEIVRIRGTSRSVSNPNSNMAILYLDCDGTALPVELGEMKAPEVGAKVEITGVCVMSVEKELGRTVFARVTDTAIVPRFQQDVRTLGGPPWWTPARFLALIALLLLSTAAVVIRYQMKIKRTRQETSLRIDERTRLAVELHDSLAQNLTGISLQLDAAEMAEDGDRQKAHRHLDNARNALRSCREGLRYCLSDLRSRSFEDTDMTEAVTETVKPHIGKAALSVRFNVPRSKLSDSSAHAVLCIIRELAVNAVRHGRADSLHVAGEFSEGTIRFSVRDNGCGFDPDSRPGPDEGHFGLLGVKERLNAFKGSLRIESKRESGAKVTATLKIA